MFLLCTIYFIWYVHHRILLVSDSLRIVLHYYIQYEVRFSLSYLKKKSISPLISRFFPFSCHILLISFYIVCLISYRKYVWCYHHLNNATSLVIQDDPLLAPIYPKMIFKFYFVYNAKSTDMKYCCIFYINFPRQLLSYKIEYLEIKYPCNRWLIDVWYCMCQDYGHSGEKPLHYWRLHIALLSFSTYYK